jgi:hypothetical protein
MPSYLTRNLSGSFGILGHQCLDGHLGTGIDTDCCRHIAESAVANLLELAIMVLNVVVLQQRLDLRGRISKRTRRRRDRRYGRDGEGGRSTGWWWNVRG